MKAKWIIVGVLVFLFVNQGSVLSQNTGSSYDVAFNKYQLSIEDYQKARSDYVLARAEYLSYQTLTAQKKAKEATIVFLQSRDGVVIKYLQTLKERILEAKGLSDTEKSDLTVAIDADIVWYEQHRETLSSAGTLGDLVKDSNEAQNRYETIKINVYNTLSYVSLGKVIDYQDRFEGILARLKDKVALAKTDEREDYQLSLNKINTIDRWLLEVDNRFVRSTEKSDGVQEMLINPGSRRRADSGYTSVVNILGESQQFLDGGTSFMNEIIIKMKTQD